MRRLLVMTALLTFGLFGAYAQSSSIILQNQETATFYYVLDPQDLQGLSVGSPLLATKVAAFFANANGDPSFSSVAPGAEARLDNVPDGTHMLVGVFAQDGETDLPVRVISIEAASNAGDRFYALFATPSQLTVTRGVGRLAWLAAKPTATAVASAQTEATTTDSQTTAPTTTTTTTNTTTTTTTTTASSAPSSTAASTTTAVASAPSPATAIAAQAASTAPAATVTAATDATATTTPALAQTTPPATAADSAGAANPATPPSPKLGQIASFASYDPILFTREGKGDFSVLPIAQSRGWQLTGTRISGLSGVIDPMGLHLALTVPGGVAESVSYFFYVFSSRAAGQTNTVTMELEPRAEGNRGACLLWQKGSNEPRMIGTVQSTPTRIELDVSSNDLDAAFGDVPSDTLSADVTSGWYDRALGTWEEFYYTTILANQIPVTR